MVPFGNQGIEALSRPMIDCAAQFGSLRPLGSIRGGQRSRGVRVERPSATACCLPIPGWRSEQSFEDPVVIGLLLRTRWRPSLILKVPS
jgi:hypothetical protein